MRVFYGSCVEYVALGHANEKVSRAAAEQCMKLVHSQVRTQAVYPLLFQ